MIHRILQNLPSSPAYAHSGNEEAGFLPHKGDARAIESIWRRFCGWLAGIDRKRSAEYETARTIEHLHKLSDSQLRDIGIVRPDIERAVRFGRDQV